jgi:hypothetical protein
VRYGIYDSYDIFLNYGYVERGAPFVVSVPLEVDLPILGKLTIHAVGGRVVRRDLPKEVADLAFFCPSFDIDLATRSAEVGHLMIPQENAPRALRRVLAIIVHKIEPSLEIPEIAAIVESIEPTILSRNVEFYRALHGYLQELKPVTGFDNIINNALEMTEVQLEKLRRYPFFHA